MARIRSVFKEVDIFYLQEVKASSFTLQILFDLMLLFSQAVKKERVGGMTTLISP
jgi:hypothetical protein